MVPRIKNIKAKVVLRNKYLTIAIMTILSVKKCICFNQINIYTYSIEIFHSLTKIFLWNNDPYDFLRGKEYFL